MFEYTCPSCEVAIRLGPARAERQITCKACKYTFTVPPTEPTGAEPAPPPLYRSRCPKCDKIIGVRFDQFGRRLRCPACRHGFVLQPAQEQPGGPPPPLDEADGGWAPADEANELVRPAPPPRSWPRAKVTAAFRRPTQVVFQAAVQVLRSAHCQLVHIDHANRHVRFAFPNPPGEHSLFVFDGAGLGCEMDIASADPNVDDVYDPCYQLVIREMGKYLLFVPDAEPPPPPPPPRSLPSRDDDDEPPGRRRRRRRRAGADGLSIAGFVCAVVGVLLSCVPLVGGGLGVLGIVFGSIGLSQRRRGENGFAVASLVVGVVACLAAFVFLIAFLEAESRRHG